MALATLGCGVMILLKVTSSIAAWIFIKLVAGIGIGVLFPAIALGIQASAPIEDTARRSNFGGFLSIFRQTLGVAIGETIFRNQMRTSLESIPSPAIKASCYAFKSVELVEQLKLKPHDSPVAIQLRKAFAQSYQTVGAIMCALSRVALITSLFVKEYDLNQEHMTEQGFVDSADKAGQNVSDIDMEDTPC